MAEDLPIEEFPKIYKRYFKREKALVKKFVKGAKSVLDVGCGEGRAIPDIAPVVGKYVGIDIDDECLKQAKKVASKFDNTEILKLDVEDLSKKFGENKFSRVVLLFNTICCFEHEKKSLKEIYKVTKDQCFLTFAAKATLDKRKEVYDKAGIEYEVNKKETIFSPFWGRVRAHNKSEILDLCRGIGFKVKEIFMVESLIWVIILEK